MEEEKLEIILACIKWGLIVVLMPLLIQVCYNVSFATMFGLSKMSYLQSCCATFLVSFVIRMFR